MTKRLAIEHNTKLKRKRLSSMIKAAGDKVLSPSQEYDIFISSQARSGLSEERLDFEKRKASSPSLKRVDEYELYAHLWDETFLANLLEEKLEGPLSNKVVCLVGSFSDQEKAAIMAGTRKHHYRMTTDPDKANLFILGKKAFAQDPETFKAMLMRKSRLPYTKIAGRAAFKEKLEESANQSRKSSHKKLYSGKFNADLYPDRFVALDLEATSDRRSNKIIEIGMVRYDHGKAVEKYQSFVNPHEKLRPVIVDLTGIHDEQLADAPDIQGIQKDILKFLKDDPVVGHSVQNDMALLADNLNLPLDNNYIDTCKIAMVMMPEREKFSLSSLAADFNLSRNTHRALDDAVTSGELLEMFKSMYDPK